PPSRRAKSSLQPEHPEPRPLQRQRSLLPVSVAPAAPKSPNSQSPRFAREWDCPQKQGSRATSRDCPGLKTPTRRAFESLLKRGRISRRELSVEWRTRRIR